MCLRILLHPKFMSQKPLSVPAGTRFGRLVASALEPELRVRADGRNRAFHLWVCDCGKSVRATYSSVSCGNTRSCGCLHRDTVSALGVTKEDVVPVTSSTHQRPRNHGQSKTPLYRCWKSMVRRCTATQDPKYKFYGGRGISVCSEWKDFMAFKTWADSTGYREGLELDRRNPDLGYMPENCRWLDKRSNILRARRGLGRYGLEDSLELRLRERAVIEKVEPIDLIARALDEYLSR